MHIGPSRGAHLPTPLWPTASAVVGHRWSALLMLTAFAAAFTFVHPRHEPPPRLTVVAPSAGAASQQLEPLRLSRARGLPDLP
jgi:hypothetical protein